MVQVTVGGSADIEAYGLDITGGVGYADDATSGVAVGDQPEGTYWSPAAPMSTVNAAWTSATPKLAGTTTATGAWTPSASGRARVSRGPAGSRRATAAAPGSGSTWRTALFLGGERLVPGQCPGPRRLGHRHGRRTTGRAPIAIETGNAQSGGLTTQWSGALPDLGGYMPMQKKGGIVLGTGGDNSNAGIGTLVRGRHDLGLPLLSRGRRGAGGVVTAGYEGNSAGTAGAGGSTSASAGRRGRRCSTTGIPACTRLSQR